jgi:hypothetical protein
MVVGGPTRVDPVLGKEVRAEAPHVQNSVNGNDAFPIPPPDTSYAGGLQAKWSVSLQFAIRYKTSYIMLANFKPNYLYHAISVSLGLLEQKVFQVYL